MLIESLDFEGNVNYLVNFCGWSQLNAIRYVGQHRDKIGKIEPVRHAASALSDNEIIRTYEKHGMKIAETAAALRITQKRLREVLSSNKCTRKDLRTEKMEERRRNVILLRSRGLSTSEIAKVLCISTSYVLRLSPLQKRAKS